MKIVAYDNLVAVTFESTLRLRDKQGIVRFKLNIGQLLPSDGYRRPTLKETTKPSVAHSSTIGFKIFGTWSISISKLPFPDCILCSDCHYE